MRTTLGYVRVSSAVTINWDNLWARPEDMLPDGNIDWESLFEREEWSPENCPIERAIAAVGRATPPSSSTPPQAPSQGAPWTGSRLSWKCLTMLMDSSSNRAWSFHGRGTQASVG
jgi:hypothetical protein